MDSIFPLIVLILVSIFSTAAKKKQETAKKAKTQLPKMAPAPKAPVPTLDDAWEVPRMETVVPTPVPAVPKAVPAVPKATPAMVPSVSLESDHHAFTPTVMETPQMHAPIMGTEGQDACHEFMLDAPEVLDSTKALSDDGLTAQEAQALVQGIIISEIMARPRQRYAWRR